MATYSCTAGGNAVVDRVRHIMLENLSIMPEINMLEK